ncbi:MAG: hypothetical protein ACI9IL_000057 [Rickettsiales bacterium]|jgi:hypothetical protein
MATNKQEDIYNKIMKYYNFIDQLIDLSQDDPELQRDAEFKIVQSIIKTLENCADDMSEEFINYIKQPRSEKIKTNTLVAIDKVITRVYEAKEKMLYIKGSQS